MQPTAFGGFFLIDLLFLADATDGTTKPDADVHGHWLQSSSDVDDAYTPDESH
jgi:hypothetical protein